MKDLKTTDLLNKINEEDIDDKLFGEILDELSTRTPFGYLEERIDELKNLMEKQEKEIKKLQNDMSDHIHLADGKSVIKI